MNLFILVSTLMLWQNAFAILPPKLSTPAREIRVKEGQQEVVLECELDIGDEPIAYRWLKQMRIVTAQLGHSYRIMKKVHLALHPITKEHAGRYECEASNDVGVYAQHIDVIVEPLISEGFTQNSANYGKQRDTSEILSELAASLNDVLAEGNCACDIMFLLHATNNKIRTVEEDIMKAQANFAYTVANNLISEKIRVSVMTYSDYANSKLSFGMGTNRCALQEAFRDLSHEKWATRIDTALQDAFKKFKKSKSACKVIILPIFGPIGMEAKKTYVLEQLKKSGIKLFVLEVSEKPIPYAEKIASTRGDGHPYHWRVESKRWQTVVAYMSYMPEELTGCMPKRKEISGVCVAPGSNCSQSSQCEGVGYGCVLGICQSLDCNRNPGEPGCCRTHGDFWCGDVTYDCKPKDSVCDGTFQCMNGLDEDRCWQVAVPCQPGMSRCHTSVLCLDVHDLCDGEAHCPGAEDEDPRFCRLFPCPNDRSFRCRDGKCISKNSLCDGEFKNCMDGEDEDLQYCSQKHVCPASKPFDCDYGVCIEDRKVCDGVYNCLDATDEILCDSKACPAERPFKCHDGKCIELDYVCNGIVDACLDGSDEKNCTSFICPSRRNFKCMNGRCIDRWLECNNRNDCGDNSDELHCDGTAPSVTTVSISTLPPPSPSPLCFDDEFFCTNGPCLDYSKVCNGIADCPNRDDEDQEFCKNMPCSKEKPYKCRDGSCGKRCDGHYDCINKADEANCPDFPDDYNDYTDIEGIPCPKEKSYKCSEGTCAKLCDGKYECDDKSDELNCGKNEASDIKEGACPESKPYKCRPPDNACAVPCDGTYDCVDKSDESNCPDKEISDSCPESKPYKCRPPDNACAVPCDGTYDCVDKSDEANCPDFTEEYPDYGEFFDKFTTTPSNKGDGDATYIEKIDPDFKDSKEDLVDEEIPEEIPTQPEKHGSVIAGGAGLSSSFVMIVVTFLWKLV